MRKTIKTAAVVAAMSALTVASTAVAFADADEITNVKAQDTANEEAAAGEILGLWDGNNKDGWTFSVNGEKFEDTWAEIDGVWYYFDGDKIVQDDLMVIDDKTYFFHADGSMMANGWYKITSEMEAYQDIEVGEQLQYDEANAYVDRKAAYDYLDYVWLYFGEDGVAKENEWMQDENDYWFYFDGNVTVMNMLNYAIAPNNFDYADSSNVKLYGFDKNGCMLTGWNSIDREDVTWNLPTDDEDGKIYFYYDPNGGEMQDEGWAKIEGKYYLFAEMNTSITGASDDETAAKVTGYPLLVNTYVKSYANDEDAEYFYLDSKGVMQTGVVTVPEDAWEITFYQDDKSIVDAFEDYNNTGTVTKKTVANFGSNGNKKEAKVGNSWYMDPTSGKVIPVDKDEVESIDGTKYILDYTDAVDWNTAGTFASNTDPEVVTGAAARVVADADVMAQLVKSAFVAKDDLYLVDEDGEIVKNRAVLISDTNNVTVTLEKNNESADYTNMYILFGSDGKALTGKKTSVYIGGVTYWLTDRTVKVGEEEVAVYVGNKVVNGNK